MAFLAFIKFSDFWILKNESFQAVLFPTQKNILFYMEITKCKKFKHLVYYTTNDLTGKLAGILKKRLR